MKLKFKERGPKQTDKPKSKVKEGARSNKNKRENELAISPVMDFIPSGSTILNLAASQRGRMGGWPRGRIIRLVGDGSSGKTVTALEACAQAVHGAKRWKMFDYPPIKRVRVRYNNVERVMDFDLEQMYALRNADGEIVRSFVDNVEWISKQTVEETGRDLLRCLNEMVKGDFLLYVVDSWDALKSEKQRASIGKSVHTGIEESDGYNLEKQTYTTQHLMPMVCDLMGLDAADIIPKKGKRKATPSDGNVAGAWRDATIIIIAQTRQNIGATFGGKRVGGGGAFGFFTHQEVWLREAKKHTKTSFGHELTYGVDIEAHFRRNKIALPYRRARFTLFFDYGIDDLGSILTWMFGPEKSNELRWDDIKALKLSVMPKKHDKTYTKDFLIKHIEANCLEDEFRCIMETAWKKVEASVKTTGRKPRFL